MALEAGTRLGPYEILAPLGAGGMGEVYRAKDTRLGRDVAIKVLPAHLSASPQLRQRLEREARAVSSLSHPHICTLHDVGREGEIDFLVMEYLEGETLADRLGKGPLPLDQTLRCASEIADALDTAHRHGVIHRDLKPGNVMLTKSGAKLLDFGLARLRESGSDADLEAVSRMPTLARPLTDEGTIPGTFPYMAPEQLEGKATDARTDLFAFGAMLYEMVTGQRAFRGESRASLIAAILEREPPPVSTLKPLTPPLLDRVVRRCLAKDPNARWQTAVDLADELRWIIEARRDEPSAGTAPRRWRAVAGVAVAMALMALAAFWLGTWRGSDGPQSTASPAPVTHTVIDLPPEAPLAVGGVVPQVGFDSSTIALSPDGSQLVYVGDTDEGTKLYIRSMDSLEVTPIPGTEDAIHPFFSPDGRWVGFLTNDQVKKVSLQGGAPLTLCDTQGWPTRASWTRDDMVYVADLAGMALTSVPADGGEPTPIVRWAAEGFSKWYGDVLPDGKSALVTGVHPGSIRTDHADILLLSLETLETRVLVESGYDARYLSSGHLLFARSGNLLAVAFDLERLEVAGEPVPVVSGVSMESLWAQAQVAVSDSGTLVYVPGSDRSVGKLAWVDRQGDTEFLPVPERVYNVLDLAPGGKRLAVHVADVNDYIWIYDIARQEGRRLTAPGAAGYPEWTPDGSAIAFASWRPDDVWRILVRAVDGADEPRELFTSSRMPGPESWSPDGRVLALYEGNRYGFLAIDGPPEPTWLQPEGSAFMPRFSPDGRWVAYFSTETGRFEVWVRSYPDGKTVRQISVEGGIEPVWCDECGELFYRNRNQWMSTAVTLDPELTWEPPRLVFETDFVDTGGRSYDVSPDGQRLLVVKRTREPTRDKLHVLHNWFEELKRRVPGSEPDR